MGINSYSLYKLYQYPDVLIERANRRYEFSAVKKPANMQELRNSSIEVRALNKYDESDVGHLKAIIEKIVADVS